MGGHTIKEYRISAGGIVIQADKILLVRHGEARHGQGFLVGPGGRVEDDESIIRAVTREVEEETGLDVKPCKILFVEDLVSPHSRVVKIWFLCEPIGGQLAKTQGAIDDGIVEARWYLRGELDDEVVCPSIIVDTDWSTFAESTWQTAYLESQVADAYL